MKFLESRLFEYSCGRLCTKSKTQRAAKTQLTLHFIQHTLRLSGNIILASSASAQTPTKISGFILISPIHLAITKKKCKHELTRGRT